MKKVHILGVAGTFMGGVAQLAKAQGFAVTGSDAAIYPPMSTQLEQEGVGVASYEDLNFLEDEQTEVVIGNALSRGNPAVEATLNSPNKYISGPQWLAENILQNKWVIAVAGTHGKTTTTAMVAWILEDVGLKPGFLIGGVPENFGVSARLGEGIFFVVEADEYDTAFFDKRSKFVHYRPKTLVLNNLEFDHADIFDDLDAIKTQFNHVVRTVPSKGAILYPQTDKNIQDVLEQGCWSETQTFGLEAGDWQAGLLQQDGSAFSVFYKGKTVGQVHWPMTGLHNVNNALAAIAASVHAGVPPFEAVDALNRFTGVKRRMTQLGTVKDITVYDDFAHHPTAIHLTLEGLRNQMKAQGATGRLIAVFEPRSNTMRMGVHKDTLPESFKLADEVYAFIDPAWNWDLPVDKFSQKVSVENSYESLLDLLVKELQPQDQVIIMSNGSFGGIHQKLLKSLG